MQLVYFSINFLIPSPHPQYDISCSFVGMSECLDLGGDDGLHIDIKEMYIGCDLNAGDTPAAYTPIDWEVADWQKNPAAQAIIADIYARFGTVNDEPADAASVCDYYQKRRELEWAKQIRVTHIN